MAQNSKIEWTTHTANLWHGCTKVHAGCDHCYAETLSKRWGNDVWGNDKPRKEVKSVWTDLAKYQKLAAIAGEMHSVFVGSMMDIFEKPMPLINNLGGAIMHNGEWLNTGVLRDMLFENISNGCYPNLKFLLLTKRPSNINKYIPENWKRFGAPYNVMFGTSPVDQATSDKLIPQLLEVNGAKFLSIEPQLGPITLRWEWIDQSMQPNLSVGTIRWIINGGESGHHRRTFDTDWARLLRHQCKSANVPFFMKQIDKVLPIPADLLIRQMPA